MRSKRNKKIIEKYQGGLALREVGEIYGLSRQAIHQILKRHGIETRKMTVTDKVRKGRGKEILKETLQNLYIEQKMSMAKIAELYSTYPGCVNSQLLAYGIPKRSASEQTMISRPTIYEKIDKEEFYSLYIEKNYTREQLAEFYGRSISSIDKQKTKFGIIKYKNISKKAGKKKLKT